MERSCAVARGKDINSKFYLRLLHPKAIAEKAVEHFFIGVLTDFFNANFGRIRQKTVVLTFLVLIACFFPPKYIFCSTEDFRVVTFS